MKHNDQLENGDSDNEIASTQIEIKVDLDKAKEVFTRLEELEDAIIETFMSLKNNIIHDRTEEASKNLRALIRTSKEINKIKFDHFPKTEANTPFCHPL